MICDRISKPSFDVLKHVKAGIRGVRSKPDRLKGLPADMLNKLVGARHARGWSQRELASKVGLPQVHISALETGKVTPRLDTLLDLVRVLGYELLLAPRAVVPVVQSLIRDAERGEPGEDIPLYAAEDTEERQ